jgi:hypothetical protein
MISSSGILTPWTKPLENVRTSTYWVCTCACQYENIEMVCTLYMQVQEFCTCMHQVCTFRNLFVKVWTSMYLPGSQHFFVVWWIHQVMKCYRIPFIGTWKHFCQSYFEKYCVYQWVNILSLYLVCTEYIQGLYLTSLVQTCTKHTSIFPQARSALRCRRVSAARFFWSTTLASCQWAVSSINALVCTVYVQCMNINALVCTMYEQTCSSMYNVCTMYEQKCSSIYRVCTMYEPLCMDYHPPRHHPWHVSA